MRMIGLSYDGHVDMMMMMMMMMISDGSINDINLLKPTGHMMHQ